MEIMLFSEAQLTTSRGRWLFQLKFYSSLLSLRNSLSYLQNKYLNGISAGESWHLWLTLTEFDCEKEKET